MRNKKVHLTVIVIFIAIIGICFYYIFRDSVGESIKLGLDLKGGTQIILKPVEIGAESVTNEALDKAQFIIMNRIDKLGISEPLVTRDYNKNLIIQLPGVDEPQRAIEVIGKTAQLEFKILQSIDENGNPIFGPTLMTGDKLVKAQAGYNSNGQIIVSMAFTDEGSKQFEKITSENVGKQLAIVLDGEMKSAPVIRQAISGGDAVIEGIDTLEEAKDIALVLQTGSLPVSLEIQEAQTIGPTLGQDSLQQSILAGIIGFTLIAIFMAAMYRGLGLISIIGLLCYVLIFWGILAALQAPLTLPGIAGIVLTIGIAVDANVLIFSRIKEEMLKGKGKFAAFNEGFRNALRAIIDSNITTLITAAALYRFGTGPIRGFAVTLAIGVLISMLTAIILVRAILFLAVNSRAITPGFIGVKLPDVIKEK
ncbi:MAG: protein translocase subunit SecD [Candidatus Hydromicrobium sp.]